MSHLDGLAASRFENRYHINRNEASELEKYILQNYDVLQYLKPWVLTVYFAGVLEEHNQATALRTASVSVKARTFLTEEIPGKTTFVPPDMVGRFEVKYRSRNNPQSPRRRKYSAENMRFNDIFLSLFTGNYNSLYERNQNFPQYLLKDILTICSCTKFVPVGFVHYLRRHFIGTDQESNLPFRGTLDSNISYWNMDWADYVYAANRVGEYPGYILEIKTANDVVPHELQTRIDAVRSLDKPPSKHDLLYAQLPTHIAMIQEEPYTQDGDDWRTIEVERKVDVSEDPRDWLRTLDLGDSYVFHTPDEQITKHTFYRSPDSVCVTEYLSIDRAASIKAKKPLTENGYIKRDEISRKNTTQGRREISEFLRQDVDQLQSCVPCLRNRTLRMMISNLTGRVFQITADHCTADDDRSPLNQVEVEYSGTLHVPSAAGDFPSLEAEMLEIQSVIRSSLTAHKLAVLLTETTKADWMKR